MTTRRRVIQGNDTVLKAVRGDRGGEPEYEEEWVLERDHNLPLRFWGNKIGSAKHAHTSEKRGERGTEVNLYVTASGKLVTEVHQWEKTEGRSRRAAQAHKSPKEALTWLIEDANGVLGTTSKEAWLAACRTFEPLAAFAVEDVD